MYRKEIEEYIDSHKDQMIEDICTLCRINSEKMPYTEGKPFGEGPFEVLQTALTMMENYEIGRASCRKECRSRWSPYH